MHGIEQCMMFKSEALSELGTFLANTALWAEKKSWVFCLLATLLETVNGEFLHSMHHEPGTFQVSCTIDSVNLQTTWWVRFLIPFYRWRNRHREVHKLVKIASRRAGLWTQEADTRIGAHVQYGTWPLGSTLSYKELNTEEGHLVAHFLLPHNTLPELVFLNGKEKEDEEGVIPPADYLRLMNPFWSLETGRLQNLYIPGVEAPKGTTLAKGIRAGVRHW